MTDCIKSAEISLNTPQCQYFVVRKKRLCRMTVRPGRHYCGEHEPQPRSTDLQADLRVPCPYDAKHTCYASKLEKHLSICNARQDDTSPYIIRNINAPQEITQCPRKPLGEISKHALIILIDKVNTIYENHIQDNITCAPVHPIHAAVLEEFAECDRAESSRRHLRQTSSLLHIAEEHMLVGPSTCYVELGAGKGQLSYFAYRAWCEHASRGSGSGVVAVDRASLRHKRDNRLRGAARVRVRADLAHLALGKVPAVEASDVVIGFAKHLCGVAMDYALRCITSDSVLAKCGGAVLATCCHHRCERAGYVANAHLHELGINSEELNMMLGIVSWATCGDGRSRERRKQSQQRADKPNGSATSANSEIVQDGGKKIESFSKSHINIESSLKDQVATKNLQQHDNEDSGSKDEINKGSDLRDQINENSGSFDENCIGIEEQDKLQERTNEESGSKDQNNEGSDFRDLINEKSGSFENGVDIEKQDNSDRLPLSQESREKVGRRAKAILDWGRILYLREKGFDAKLCYYVPTSVSLENLCIVAKKVC